MRKFIIGGNWKMQVTTIKKSVEIAKSISHEVNSLPNINKLDVFICPSFNALSSVSKVIENSNLKLGAQNVHSMRSGAFTGEISIESLLECNVEYVLVGHSERRRIFNESNESINLKIKQVIDNGMKAILCIGESAEEFVKGKTQSVNWDQLSKSLDGISKEDLKKIVIAYEPVWAINNKFLNPNSEIRPATPSEAGSSHVIVRKWFEINYSEDTASKVRIQYGGSMNKDNCDELLKIKDIDGGLIGSASFSAENFIPIIKSAI